ncbi:hypothetical protein LOTGIDRAFT_193829 [Lottia gigantea]|uniref:Fibronectin type III-like domain-containing protein n=1 Tax=Lottia gigantea TaxID=225164 RepID=V4BHE2_LOTGI|nr:hypothetical protein LOTGIDRAFT_193829 [Lottia gigantea]ESO87969.1 hypothetical protein LOTGIDRAFT_193829 [Lottia gigantea]
MDPSLTWDERVHDLVSRLTEEEMMNQMAKGRADIKTGAPSIPRLGIGEYDWATECLHGDAIAGNATSFPQAIGLAATWSKDVLYRVAEATSVEVRAKNNNYTKHGLYGFHMGLSCFSPVINILRDPRWGRCQETYGEDPHLTGALAQSFVRGLQGGHPRYIRASAACKHFDAHSGPENIPKSRLSFNSIVSERDWRTTFLPAFKDCVDAGVYSIMCSYNSINGVPACANKKLLTDILRNEWGFSGYVVSDAGAIENVWHFHNYTTNDVDTVATTVNAGVNLNLAAGTVYEPQAIEQVKLPDQIVRERMKPLWYTRMRLGEFDPDYMNPYSNINLGAIQSKVHQELSLETAMKSFVLLKNIDNTLPLPNTRFHWISIVGPMIDSPEQLFGSYAPTYDPKFTVTPYYGLERLGGNITSGQGCEDNKCEHYAKNDIINAVYVSEVVFVCLGLGTEVEAEGKDRDTIDLPGGQLQLLKDAVKYSPENAIIILIIFNAGAVDLSWAEQNSKISAIIAAFYPGQTTGTALRKLITHDGPYSVPAARLPFTWPKSDGQLPPMVNYNMTGRTYRYLKDDQEPLYPFGYGLSYTQFQYDHVSVDLPVKDGVYIVNAGDDLNGSVFVKNKGQYEGEEVSQVYIQWKNIEIQTPKLQLVDFARQHIPTKEYIKVDFTIAAEKMAVWTDDGGWIILPCTLHVFIGGQQPFQTKPVGSNIISFEVKIQGQKMLK